MMPKRPLRKHRPNSTSSTTSPDAQFCYSCAFALSFGCGLRGATDAVMPRGGSSRSHRPMCFGVCNWREKQERFHTGVTVESESESESDVCRCLLLGCVHHVHGRVFMCRCLCMFWYVLGDGLIVNQ